MEKLKNIHPGEILLEEFLKPMRIKAYRLAKETNIPLFTYFDGNLRHTINCFVEDLKDTLSNNNDVATATIYSDQKLQEKGGAEKVKNDSLNKNPEVFFPGRRKKTTNRFTDINLSRSCKLLCLP